MDATIQRKWREGFLVGYDCIAFGDGRVVMANTYLVQNAKTRKEKRYWFPLCDTTLASLQKYGDDIWTATDVWNGSFEHQNQTIVFGEGAMGNEGFVASLGKDGHLNWSIFFTFSNPISSANVTNGTLVCCGDSGTEIRIALNEITSIEIRSVSLR